MRDEIGEKIVKSLTDRGLKVMVIDNNKLKDMETFEVNGVKFQKRKLPTKRPISKPMRAILIMAMAMGVLDSNTKKSKEISDIDIIREYELIQKKKSTLSRSQRDWVVDQFERRFEEVI